MSHPVLGIVDCGSGNFRSLTNVLSHISDCQLVISKEITKLEKCDKLIIPGVGSFMAASEPRKIKSLKDIVDHFRSNGKDILGICLGMQILFNSSSEGGTNIGLQIFKQRITHFSEHPNYHLSNKILVPHVGLNSILFDRKNCILKGIENESRFYFTHSYCAPPGLDSTVCETTYGSCNFSSVVQADNVYGVQFHPELSGQIGLKLLRNFIQIS
tara:strand:+ start:207 stop:848 length:642 start_codon:yes stop_codon:yes gene_type:complete